MSEAIITRRGKGTNGGSIGTLATEFVIQNSNYTVPNAINQQFEVMLFGGGGAYGKLGSTGMWTSWVNTGGGGGGWMNNASITLTEGTNVPVTIGAGGTCTLQPSGIWQAWNSTAGGSSAFGAYLSANGGSTANYSRAGSGGSGGGGASASYYAGMSIWYNVAGGIGYQFGGGGGCGGSYVPNNSNWVHYSAIGGNGGPWGGGGGSGGIHNSIGSRPSYARGGTYGGNGGIAIYNNRGYVLNNSIDAEVGTNTLNQNITYNGNGAAGSMPSYYGSTNKTHAGGGGGGYGGMGGNSQEMTMVYGGSNQYMAGGGGGGYGARGGHAGNQCGGGGGGYGHNGGDGGIVDGIAMAGGGGGYGAVGYGAGGGCNAPNGVNGMHGICIIQYYKP